MKKILKILVLSMLAAVFLVAGTALAQPFYTGPTYAPYGPGISGVPADLGPGYIIWSNEAGTEWSVFVTGRHSATPGDYGGYNWYGEVLYDGEILSLDGSLLEGGESDPVLTENFFTDTITYGTYWAGPHYDGFTFTLTGVPNENELLFWLGGSADLFNVYIGESTTPVYTNLATLPSYCDVASFKVNAPAPEPATLLLMGSGLLGAAGIGRKRFTKR